MAEQRRRWIRWLAAVVAVSATTSFTVHATHDGARRFMHVLEAKARDDKSRAGASPSGFCPHAACQLMIRTSGREAAVSVHKRLQLNFEPLCFTYMPHDSFLGLFNTSTVAELAQTSGVGSVSRMDPALKIAPTLAGEILLASEGASRAHALLEVLWCADPLREELAVQLTQAGLAGVSLTQASKSKLLIDTPSWMLNQTVTWLIQHEHVFFVGIKLQASAFNSYTSTIIKGNPDDNKGSALFSHLNGEGEVIGVADTGAVSKMIMIVNIRLRARQVHTTECRNLPVREESTELMRAEPPRGGKGYDDGITPGDSYTASTI